MADTLQLLPDAIWPGYVVAGAVSGLVGLADIFTRYRDDPWGAVATPPATAYLAANAAFGVAAYWLAIVLDIVHVTKVDLARGLTVDLIRSALLVGLGATLVLRAVAFNISIGGKVNSVGASTIVDALLRACDQEIDRALGARKDKRIRTLMKGISFEWAKLFIPNYCLALMEEDDGRAERLGRLVAAINGFKAPLPTANPPVAEDPLADSQRAFLLGSTLINLFGWDVARNVIQGMKYQQTTPPQS